MKNKLDNNRLGLGISILIFKLLLEFSYVILLAGKEYYPIEDINWAKYIIGCLCIVALFYCVDINCKRISSFLLLLLLVTQIIPITCIYAVANKSTKYYLAICASLLFVEIVVRMTYNIKDVKYSLDNNDIFARIEERLKKLSSIVILFFFSIIVIITVYLIIENGLPSMMALNFENVYRLRSQMEGKIGYHMDMVIKSSVMIIAPFLFANCKKNITRVSLIIYILVIYLYTGNKTFLFSIPLIVAVYLWGMKTNDYRNIWNYILGILSILMLVALIIPESRIITRWIYSLLVRRSLIVPAVIKFTHYDFFCSHPKLGLDGVISDKILHVNTIYSNTNVFKEISNWAYGLPEMNANTGFLAEGYARFGMIGVVTINAIYGLMLILADFFQNRVGYVRATTTLIYIFFSLTDTYLLGQIFRGTWLVVTLIMLLYIPEKDVTDEKL